jgi:hypothetical protein
LSNTLRTVERVAVALAALQAILLFATTLRPAASVAGLPLGEDGFYALTIARNIAAGRGVTIDGETWTNGFQPLFTFIEAGCFRLAHGDDVLALRFVGMAAWLIHLAGAWLMARIALDLAAPRPFARTAGATAGFLYLAAPALVDLFYNGLETVLEMTLILALWRLAQRGALLDLGGALRFGAVLGLAVLARIDVGFLAAALALHAAWRDRAHGIAALRLPAAMATSATLISSPWWLYNRIVFGSFVPSSATAQQLIEFEWLRITEALWSLRLDLVPWVFVHDLEGLASDLLRCAVIVALALAAWRLRPRREEWSARPDIAFALCLLAAWGALILFYVTTFFAYWFYLRYFAPLALPALIIAALIFAAHATSGARLLIAGMMIIAVGATIMPIIMTAGRAGPSTHQPLVDLVRAHVPESDFVASGQSGTLGYFRARVVNVDGKVNRDVLAERGNVGAYLDRRRIVWFVDSPWGVERMLGTDPGARGWEIVARSTISEFVLYKRVYK